VDNLAAPSSLPHPRRLLPTSRAALAAGWLVTLLAAYGVLAGTGFVLRDPDSELYEYIAHALEQAPLADWIAPSWQPGRWKQGLFQEHLAVFFWPATVLGQLGFSRGMLLANLVFHLGALWVLFRLARHLAGESAAWAAVFLYVLSPLGLQYVARGNHENAWALCTGAALLCLLRRHEGARYGWGFVAWAVGAFLVKGILGLMLFPAAAALWARDWLRERPRWAGTWRGAWPLVAAAVAVALSAALYEAAYAARTGVSFFGAYVGAQMAYVQRFEATGVLQKALNVPYYAANLLYFALPGSLLLLAALGRRRPEGPTAAQRMVAVGGGAAVLAVSLMTRRAARYVFPVYPWLAVPAAEEALRRWPRLKDWLEARAQLLPWLLMGLVLLVTLGRALLNPVLTQHIDPLR
jgi:4-amino-4-deoxy-L-arabinose transferase-like glycosyltransferase